MKFVIAPDKFKGSLTGFEFCDAVEEGLLRVFENPEILKMPLADGGDGTIEIVRYYLNAAIVKKRVNDPLFRPVEASYVYSKENGVAYIEMAEASGLVLLMDNERNCMNTSSYGTGELVLNAIDRGAKEIILGIGGSATNDGGMGMAKALGFRFLDKNDRELEPIGSNLIQLNSIDGSKVNFSIKGVSVKIACDVTNPLYGKEGAAYVYAAQKGASKAEIELLDEGLKNYAKIINTQYGINIQNVKGSGAAGGLGAGALVLLNGKLTPGIDLVKEIANFDQAIKGSDWIVTGEGKLDSQTLFGKTIDGVLKSARLENIPVIALCGVVDISEDVSKKLGLSETIAVSQGITDMQIAMDTAYENVVKSTFEFAQSLK